MPEEYDPRAERTPLTPDPHAASRSDSTVPQQTHQTGELTKGLENKTEYAQRSTAFENEDLGTASSKLQTSQRELVELRRALAAAETELIKKQAKIEEQNAALATADRELATLKQLTAGKLSVVSDHELQWNRSLVQLVEQLGLTAIDVADACRHLAKAHFRTDNFSTLVLASLAQALDPRPFIRKWYGFSLQKNGLIDEAAFVLEELAGKISFSPSEQRAFERLPKLGSEQTRSEDEPAPDVVCLYSKHDDTAAEFIRPVASTEQVPKLALCKPISELRVACIMDEFTFSSYAHEATFQPLTPDRWNQELLEFKPELLFVESAWRGEGERWGGRVSHLSQELQGILSWCREQRVPTVFWNKEDPVHFGTFLNTATHFDYVFSTDIDCISRYKAALGHERVYVLPFACQPMLHNPIERYDRKNAFCFAGAYYARYPERTRDLESFVEELPNFLPVEIYDRNYGKDDVDYKFPERYQPFIVGSLSFDQIDKAYKGYNFAINLNSIKQSQSMFARRVYEVLASNTLTVSNYSRGLRQMFGDLVISSDSSSEVVRRLRDACAVTASSRRLRLAGLRKVMREHTYDQRLAYIASKVSGQAIEPPCPKVAVLARANSEFELSALRAHYERQTYQNTALYAVVSDDWEHSGASRDHRINLLKVSEAEYLTIGDFVGDADLVATMVPEDYYGPNYLLDSALATKYTDANVIGKTAHHQYLDGQVRLVSPENAYRFVRQVPIRSAVVKSQSLHKESLVRWVDDARKSCIEAQSGLSIDEFNYCRDGAFGGEAALGVADQVDDLPNLNYGLPLNELLQRAEQIAPQIKQPDQAPVILGSDLARQFPATKHSAISLAAADEGHWQITSKLPDGKHDYLYCTTDHRPTDLGYEGTLKLLLDTTTGLNLRWVVLFLDEQKQRISHVIIPANRNFEGEIPSGTTWIRFGLRVYGSGTAKVRSLVLGHRRQQPSDVIARSEHLLLTNNYPSYDSLYRNGFVHRRVIAYKDQGVEVDVFRLRTDDNLSFHEFDNFECITGSEETLHRMLSSGQYRSVLVHFLDEAMWEVLRHYTDKLKIIVWVHGAEIQPVHRRQYNFQTDKERAIAEEKSDRRMTFWRELLGSMPSNMHLVFVSRRFANDVMEDLGFRISERQYSVIHNPIDTKLFNYLPKPAEQRLKILSVRPFASAVYANDLSVQAILTLSTMPLFQHLEFRIVGDGPLFESTVVPLRSFANVIVEKRFLSQSEISTLHKEYGVFLCPTRLDTQGVSRDEAMASGLVPVTNGVAAVPEFVDASCGWLAGAESSVGLAEGIMKLYHDPELFLSMSRKAAQRVRRQSDAAMITEQELSLLLRRLG